jgi:hypothetical protein
MAALVCASRAASVVVDDGLVPDRHQVIDCRPLVIRHGRQLGNGGRIARLSRQREDVIQRGGPRLGARQADLVKAGLAVAAVLQSPQPDLVVDGRVVLDVAQDALGGAVEPVVELGRRHEPAEQSVRDLQMEALGPGEVDAHGAEVDPPRFEAVEHLSQVVERPWEVALGVDIDVAVVGPGRAVELGNGGVAVGVSVRLHPLQQRLGGAAVRGVAVGQPVQADVIEFLRLVPLVDPAVGRINPDVLRVGVFGRRHRRADRVSGILHV